MLCEDGGAGERREQWDCFRIRFWLMRWRKVFQRECFGEIGDICGHKLNYKRKWFQSDQATKSSWAESDTIFGGLTVIHFKWRSRHLQLEPEYAIAKHVSGLVHFQQIQYPSSGFLWSCQLWCWDIEIICHFHTFHQKLSHSTSNLACTPTYQLNQSKSNK